MRKKTTTAKSSACLSSLIILPMWLTTSGLKGRKRRIVVRMVDLLRSSQACMERKIRTSRRSKGVREVLRLV